MKYYSTFKRYEILTHFTMWVNFEDLMVHELSLTQKDRYYGCQLTEVPIVGKYMETECRTVITRGREGSGTIT